MPKILVNYKKKKDGTFEVLRGDLIYADLPVAEMDMLAEYDEILVVPVNNRMTIVDKVEYLSKNKIYKLIALEDGTVAEDEKGTEIYLPIGTDISKLRLINNQLVLSNENDKEDNN